MYKIKLSYSITLTYATLEDAERAMEMLFEGGMEEVSITFAPRRRCQND